MTTKPHTRTARKLSWQYDDLAQKIQVAPRHLAAKLVLRHLGSKADDKGQSHHGYDSLAAHCSIVRSQVSLALRYLRDTLKVVSWIKGTGGPKRQDTSLYTLNISAMRKLITDQGVFDIKTGKLIRVESVQRTGLKPQSSLLNGLESSPLKASKQPSPVCPADSVQSVQRSVTLSRTLSKSNPHSVTPSAAGLEIGVSLSGEEPGQQSTPSSKNPAAKIFDVPEGFRMDEVGDLVAIEGGPYDI